MHVCRRAKCAEEAGVCHVRRHIGTNELNKQMLIYAIVHRMTRNVVRSKMVRYMAALPCAKQFLGDRFQMIVPPIVSSRAEEG